MTSKHRILLVFLAAVTLLAAPVSAQYDQSRVFVSPALGLGASGGGTAVGVMAEIRIGEKIGVAALYTTWNHKKRNNLWGGDWVEKKSTFKDFGAFAAWHFLPEKKVDPFVGVGVINEVVSIERRCSFDPCPSLGIKSDTVVTAAPIAGVRWFFSPRFAVHAMAAAGLSYNGSVGITISF